MRLSAKEKRKKREHDETNNKEIKTNIQNEKYCNGNGLTFIPQTTTKHSFVVYLVNSLDTATRNIQKMAINVHFSWQYIYSIY